MRIASFVSLSIGAVLAVPAFAQTPTPAVPTQPQAAAASDLICRRVEETGSLVKKKKKQCYTKAEWDRLAAMSRDAMGQGAMTGGTSGQ